MLIFKFNYDEKYKCVTIVRPRCNYYTIKSNNSLVIFEYCVVWIIRRDYF